MLTNKNLESIKKIGGRWGVLRCLYEVLCGMRLDIPHSIYEEFEATRSIIETSCRPIGDAEMLLDWIEGRITEKAISLDNLAYWESLLRKAKKGELTKKEFREAPLMETLIEKYGFLSYCTPDLGIHKNEWEIILTERKSVHEIRSLLGPYEKLVVVGCGLCATATQTGGEEQVKDIIQQLKDEKIILGSAMIESPCDAEVAKRDMRKVSRKIAKVNAILALCCDEGVQTLGELTGKTVIPALKTCGPRELNRS